MEKEAIILGSPHLLRGKLDKGTDKVTVMTVMVKDLVDIKEAVIRKEAMRMRLGLRATVAAIGGAGMIKGGEAATEIAALEFETHASSV